MIVSNNTLVTFTQGQWQTLTHDLRNAIHNIIVSSDYVGGKLYSSEIVKNLTVIRENAHTILGLIDLNKSPIVENVTGHPATTDIDSVLLTNLNPLVLIADDSLANRMAVRTFLKKFNCKFIDVASGVDALERIKKNQPHIILLDIRMPEMDGVAVLKQIKHHNDLNGIPVIMMTASENEIEVDECKRLGCESFLYKPFTKAEIQDLVAKTLLDRYCRSEKIGIEELIEQENNENQTRSAMFIFELKDSLIPEWKVLREDLFLDQIVRFAKKGLIISERYHCEPLRIWCKKLITQAETFNLEQVELTMNKLPQILTEISPDCNV
jgi:CheY-like chemotaxis protein